MTPPTPETARRPATDAQIARISWFIHRLFSGPIVWRDSIREMATDHIWGTNLCVRPEQDWPR